LLKTNELRTSHTPESAKSGYGQSGPGLARYASASYGIDLSEDDARRLRSKFFGIYRKLGKWHAKARREARTAINAVRTRLGRRRLIPCGASEWDRFTALVNTPVQGGTADGMKQALIFAAQRIPEEARIVATVHDEIVVECPEEVTEQVREILIGSMTEAMAALFPGGADRGRGQRLFLVGRQVTASLRNEQARLASARDARCTGRILSATFGQSGRRVRCAPKLIPNMHALARA
jgi:hypothetical protein